MQAWPSWKWASGSFSASSFALAAWASLERRHGLLVRDLHKSIGASSAPPFILSDDVPF